MSINMIYLIGMMGSGKSTIGKQAASIAGLPFYDADYLIEQKLGLTISAVFEKYGEERFRHEESVFLRELSEEPFGIAAVGGGAILRPENVELLKRTGYVVWIYRDIDEIRQKVSPEGRPLLSKGVDEVFPIYAKRRPLYEAAADKVFDYHDGAEELAKLVAAIPR